MYARQRILYWHQGYDGTDTYMYCNLTIFQSNRLLSILQKKSKNGAGQKTHCNYQSKNRE